MGLRAVVLPHPPLLAAELTGPGAVAAEPLRAACDAAVTDLLAGARPELIVVGPGAVTRRHSDDAWGTLAGYGVTVSAPARSDPSTAGVPRLPLSLTLGCYLVDRAARSPGAAGVRELHEVAVDDDADRCRRLGTDLAARRPDAAWLVLGDGTTRRTERAPGAFDPRAEAFDTEVEVAFAMGRPTRLLALDAARGAALGVAGRAAWQVLAGAWEVLGGGRAASARVDYAAAPFGVGCLVVRWSDPT